MPEECSVIRVQPENQLQKTDVMQVNFNYTHLCLEGTIFEEMMLK